jgi:hypothetical protein
MITVGNPPKLAPAVKTQLDNLRLRIRQYVWAEGIANGLAWLGAAFWITLAIDWFFEPSVSIRILLLCAVICVLLIILIRQIVRRLFVHLTDSNMAVVLERRFPHLNDSLLTSVELCDRQEEPASYDAEMLSLACQEAAKRMQGVRIDHVFNFRPLRNSIMAGILLIFSMFVFGVTFPNAFSTWALRNLASDRRLFRRRV